MTPSATGPGPTGHPWDDRLLALLADTPRGLSAPRDWIHYLLCSTVPGQQELVRTLVADGWTVRPVTEPLGVIASREDLAVDPANVRAMRAYFEALAASVPGGDYDGWEAEAG